MTSKLRYLTAWCTFLLLAFFLHSTLRINTFSLIPFPVVVAVVIAFLYPAPLAPLAMLAAALITTSTMPPLYSLIIIFLPYLSRRLLPGVKVELSLTLLGLFFFIVTLQLSLLFMSSGVSLTSIPWYIFELSSTLTTIVAYSLALIWQESSLAYSFDKFVDRFW